MPLQFYNQCVTSSTATSLFLNLLFTASYGIYIPKEGSWLSQCWWLGFGKPRGDHTAPQFFRELRLLFITVSIIYNIIRLIFSSIFRDVSVPLIVVRIFINVVILIEQLWMCANWHEFFVKKQMRTYFWYRMFATLSLFFVLVGIRECISYVRWKEMVFYIVNALQFQLWYYWGKGWQFTWMDMQDDRRMKALRNGILCSAFVDFIYFFYTWKVNGYTSILIIAVISLLFLGGIVHLIIVRDRRNTHAFFKTYATSMQPSSTAAVSFQSEKRHNNNDPPDVENGSRDDVEDGLNTATNDVINGGEASNKHEHNEGKEQDNVHVLLQTAANNDDPSKSMTIDITTKETTDTLSSKKIDNLRQSEKSDQGLIMPLDNLLPSIDENTTTNNNNNNNNNNVDPSSSVAAVSNGNTNLIKNKQQPLHTLESHNVIIPALLTEKTVFIPERVRESLEQRIEDQHISHVLVDKIAVLTSQTLIWFMVVFMAEIIFIIVYGPPSVSTWQWCNDFSYSDPYTSPQSLFDMLTR